MRVAVLSLENPYVRSHGGTLRTRAIIDGLLQAGMDVACVFPGQQRVGDERHYPRRNLRLIGVAEAALDAGRWPPWLQRLKRTLLPMPTQTGGRNRNISAALRSLGRTELLVVSMIGQARYVDDLSGARLWLDHSDLHSEFLVSEIKTRKGLAARTASLQRRQLIALERERSEEATIVTTAGWKDQRILQSRVRRPVDWLPTPILDVPDATPAIPPGPPTAGFFANFFFSPNVSGYRTLVQHWIPTLRGLGWETLVAGLGSETLPPVEGVHLVGSLKHPREFYEGVHVTLAPLQIGGGMKVKVVESLMYGRPVIATPFALEGFPPSIRALVHLVDAYRPEFHMLQEGLGATAPPSEALSHELTMFRPAVARAEVVRLIEAALETEDERLV